MANGVNGNANILWQGDVPREVPEFLLYTAAADYTAKRILTYFEREQSRLEQLIGKSLIKAIVRGEVPEVMKHVNAMVSNQAQMMFLARSVTLEATIIQKTFGVRYSVHEPEPSEAQINLNTPAGSLNLTVRFADLQKHDESPVLMRTLTCYVTEASVVASVASQYAASRLGL